MKTVTDQERWKVRVRTKELKVKHSKFILHAHFKRANISLVLTIRELYEAKLSTPKELIINHVTLTKQNEHNFITPILLDTSFILHYHYLALSILF